MSTISYVSFSLSAVNYHALQTSVQHRLRHGLAFGAAYTFSKALGTQGQDPYNNTRQWYYGPLNHDRTHLASWNFAYNVPAFGAHSKVIKAVFGNWTMSGIGIVTTGAPATPTCSSTAGFPYSDPGLTGTGNNSISGVRCAVVGDRNAFTHDFYHNFNTAAFGLAQIGTFGNTGIGVLRQPTWWNFDAALDKRVSLGERAALRLRFQAFNVFNHTEFSSIGSTFQWNAAGVNLNTVTGQYTATKPPRQMALTARIEF
jgi:hypothetical protein